MKRNKESVVLLLLQLCFYLIIWGFRAAAVNYRSTDKFDLLTVWIEGKEIEHFVGYPMNIFIIDNGKVNEFLRDAYMDTHLPILPPEVSSVRISWMGSDDKYLYDFADLRSLDPQVMYDPLMSIPEKGIIPPYKNTFQITLSCTGTKTGIASMYLSLKIVNGQMTNIQGSPLKLHIRKRCIAAAESKKGCDSGCNEVGTCVSGKCHCKAGYFGLYCQFASCYPVCMNNGTCTKPGKCDCPKGYRGERCEKVKCKANCNDRGTCVAPNTCKCEPEYYGNKCQHKAGLCEIPCQNGGICNKDNKCKCPKGYSGTFCHKPLCNVSCGVHGFCSDVNKCECYRGWRGRNCHKIAVHRDGRLRNLENGNTSRQQRHIKAKLNKNKPKCKADCNNRGKCIAENTCECQPEYYGKKCQHRTDDRPRNREHDNPQRQRHTNAKLNKNKSKEKQKRRKRKREDA